MKKISCENAIYFMHRDNKPVLEVEPGELLEFEARDCFSDQIQEESQLFESADWSQINPATGPVAIKGAEPGDTLVIDILDIKVDDKGTMIVVPDMGALADKIDQSETKIVPIVNGYAQFNDKIHLPIKPMIGVIGVAPEDDEKIPNGTPGFHGGNMDNKKITRGTRLFLPVFHPGGMLALGDLHAVMGDGEVVICGVEVPGEVLLKVDIIKGKTLKTPFLETPDCFYVIGTGKDLDDAGAITLDRTFAFLKERLPLTSNEVSMLMSIACDLQICQIVDPLITCRMAIPKQVFALYNLSFA